VASTTSGAIRDRQAPARPGHVVLPSPPRSGFIAGRAYDLLLFLLPPTYALVLGIAISGTAFADRSVRFYGQQISLAALAVGVLVHAHLFAVVFRSHADRQVFRRHPVRFAVVPLVLFTAMVSSSWVIVSASVLATFWDVYHSGAQTFGFARIYDVRRGNDPAVGRRLDWWLNQILYAGPIVGGAVMLAHFGDFREFDSVGATFFDAVPVFMEGHQRIFTWCILGGGTAFLVFYVAAYVRLARRGYRISPQKVFLLTTTGACSIYTWGFNSFGQAFFIMNLFHAVQYFGIVWWAEKKNLLRLFRVEGSRLAVPVAVGLFLALPVGYGVFAMAVDTGVASLWAITLVVSLMHFWYDGFVWSVRRHEVA
jgi:hypothetical protein